MMPYFSDALHRQKHKQNALVLCEKERNLLQNGMIHFRHEVALESKNLRR